MKQGNAGLLALCVLLGLIAFGTIFVAPMYLDEAVETASGVAEAPEMADLPQTAEEDSPAPADDPSAEAGKSPLPDTADTDGADAAPGEDDVPAFDVLRVEPDGSTVIAGRARPGGTLDVMSGDEVIASAKVGPSGDFAAVLDEPLSPGDYQLTLRVSPPEGQEGDEIRSSEVATVSIPETGDGDLLAMVTEPGKASRIIAQPSASDGAPSEGGAAQDVPAVAESSALGSTVGETEPSESQVQDGAEIAAANGENGSVDGRAGPDVSASEPDGTATSANDGDATQVAGAAPTANEDVDDTSGIGAGSEVAAGEPANPTETGQSSEAASLEDGNQRNRSLATNDDVEDGSKDGPDRGSGLGPDVGDEIALRIDAVEVENDRMFVTGSADPRATVRVYANRQPVGEDDATDEGRFLVEGVMPLDVGEHRIVADEIIGGEVVARVIVPFVRPEGDAAAAVARAEGPASPPAAVETERKIAKVAGDDGAATADAATAEATDETATAGFDAEGSNAMVQSSSNLGKTGRVADEPDEPISAEGAAEDIAAGDATATGQPADQPAPMDAASESAATNPAAAPTAPADDSGALEPRTNEPSELAARDTAAIATMPETGPAVETIEQAALEPTDDSVIIRRGDTLWQISRRVYGQGVRYTTIYLANQQEIQDPDRIMPGQIFAVPDEALENAEEIHRRVLNDRR